MQTASYYSRYLEKYCIKHVGRLYIRKLEYKVATLFREWCQDSGSKIQAGSQELYKF